MRTAHGKCAAACKVHRNINKIWRNNAFQIMQSTMSTQHSAMVEVKWIANALHVAVFFKNRSISTWLILIVYKLWFFFHLLYLQICGLCAGANQRYDSISACLFFFFSFVAHSFSLYYFYRDDAKSTHLD